MKYKIRNDAATQHKLCNRDSIPIEVIPLLCNVPVVMTKGNQLIVRVVFAQKRATFNIAMDCVEVVEK